MKEIEGWKNLGMHGEIETQNFYNTKEEFIDHFTHDIWFLDSIERRHTLAFMLYSLSITDDRQPWGNFGYPEPLQ